MSEEAVVIVALGACTPLGRNAWSSAAAVRAGVSAFTQHPHLIDSAGEPVRAAIAPWLDIDLGGVDRLQALLFPALDEALQPLRFAAPRPQVALALGLPSPRPGLAPDLQAQMGQRLRERYGSLFSATPCFPAGHAAGLVALDAAFNKLRQGGLDACVVAGVDSWIEPPTLAWLEASEQLHSAGPLNNAWGCIPGEGAGAVLLMREAAARALGLPAWAQVLGTGLATEPKRIKTPTVCIGEGLTQAFRAALASLPAGALVSDVYCDMNGEPYRADEYGFTCLRTRGHFASAADFIAPADCWGDVAAAGGVLHTVLAVAAARKGYAKGPLAFAWASAEGGERAAGILDTRAAANQATEMAGA